MPFKEKDLDVPILPTHMDVTHLQMKIKKLFKQMLQKLKKTFKKVLHPM